MGRAKRHWSQSRDSCLWKSLDILQQDGNQRQNVSYPESVDKYIHCL